MRQTGLQLGDIVKQVNWGCYYLVVGTSHKYIFDYIGCDGDSIMDKEFGCRQMRGTDYVHNEGASRWVRVA